jgi:hypothetical protein
LKELGREKCEALLKLSEKKLAADDPFWIVEESDTLQIKTKTEDIVSLKLNYAQKKFIEKVKELYDKGEAIRIVVLKARQLGISTVTDALIYAFTALKEGINSLILADDVDGGNYLLDIVKLYHERSPEHLRYQEKKSNEKKLEFKGSHSQILIDTANNTNAGRKYTYRFVHLSEVAFFPPNKVNSVMGGLLQTVPKSKGTFIVAESTANGIGNYFHDLWTKAEQGENDWYPLFIAWFENPEYRKTPPKGFSLTEEEKEYKQDVFSNTGVKLEDDRLFFRRMIVKNDLNGDKDLFRQEYPAYPAQAFLVTGRRRFDEHALVNLRANQKKPLRVEGNWIYFDDVVQGRPYIIGADPSGGGIDGTNVAAVILDPIKYRIVGVYCGKLEPENFGYELCAVGTRWNEAQLAVEVNNHGLTTLTTIKNQHYPNIYYRKVYDRHQEVWTKKIGWLTSAKTKPYMVDHLAGSLVEGLDVPCAKTIDELFTFVVNDDGTCGPEKGKLADRVMALGIAIQAHQEGSWEERVNLPDPVEKKSAEWYKKFERANNPQKPKIGLSIK